MEEMIRLIHGRGEATERGDTIFGDNSNAKEIMRWPKSEKPAALAELSKHRCIYREEGTFHGRKVIIADEWALEYFESDEEGEFFSGSDFDLAEVDEIILELDGEPERDVAKKTEFTAKAYDLFGQSYAVRWKALPGGNIDGDVSDACDWGKPVSVKKAGLWEDVTAICRIPEIDQW